MLHNQQCILHVLLINGLVYYPTYECEKNQLDEIAHKNQVHSK